MILSNVTTKCRPFLAFKLVVLCFVVFCGVAIASPAAFKQQEEIAKHREYAKSLNAMASVLMGKYRKLLTTQDNITAIQIIDADLLRQGEKNKYHFDLETIFVYGKEKKLNNEVVHNIFEFELPTSSKPIINRVTKVKPTNFPPDYQIKQIPLFNSVDFKVREFAHAWLAWLDGTDLMYPFPRNNNEIDSTKYSLRIGNYKFHGSIASTVAKRKKQLGHGGHLLRSLTLTKQENDKPRSYKMELVIDWQGVNENNKPVLANIHQEIEFYIQDDGSMVVLTIDEKHLLPETSQWGRLLC